eukprot:CAMPEP_0117026060 /NCGR_PEP_ID=MMETSP0472-20121206/19187_1 /TAXON_ID=693140 ORGANISM="Tiarina fusus, Strain LIS" /NCGR_SAMPLE_ID=MMETSP0472 /ASSEMBLY_ACC=CAM_ASM_000603 /LENGTH=281 /DNA_ID=CAMNT_0004732945 /DNA_START=523 /DNA_END=1371 /DNA_ORIENTATION=-
MYSREFQLQLQPEYFENSREEGIDYYMRQWSEASKLDYKTLPYFKSIREEHKVEDMSACGSNDVIRQRIYLTGDWEGLVTVDIKTKGPLTLEEAESEPFSPSELYAPISEEQIEQDIFPCEADFAGDTRVFLNEVQSFKTCSDIDAFFPKAVSKSDTEVETIKQFGYVYTASRNGTYLEGWIKLDVTLVYETLEDAMSDSNLVNGEFSFTVISEGNNFSDEQTKMGIEIYDSMLTSIGSHEEEYPCGSVSIEEFFDSSDNSSATILSSCLFLVPLVIMFLL